jgi:glutamate synthase domain-containing protein 2
MEFVQQLRELSGGKPIGFKLCIGRREQFLGICKAMLATGIKPDFITVDGGEGGTGAAPTEMTNSVGTPLRDALIFVDRALRGTNLRDDIRIIASGKMFSAFHMLRSLALGADMINSARGMMMALGCIQARSCNTGHCPTGIATQDPVRSNVSRTFTKRPLRIWLSLSLRLALAACQNLNRIISIAVYRVPM